MVQGTVDRIVYTNGDDGWSVVRLSVPGRHQQVTAVGNLLGAQAGEQVRMTGRWSVDPKYGEQFRADAFVTMQPSTVAGIEKYLGSGLVHGLGPKMAARLVARFGMETLDIIELYPNRLTEVDGIGPVRAGRIQRAWTEQKAIKEVMIFLQGHGLSPSLAVRIYRRYGPTAIATVGSNPYRLADEVRGIGFRTADRIAARVGIPSDAPERIRAGILYTLHRLADDGHIYSPREDLVTSACQILSDAVEGRPGPETPTLSLETVAEEVGRLIASGDLNASETPDGQAVLLPSLDAAERGIVTQFVRLRNGSLPPVSIDITRAVAWYEEQAGMAFSPLQRQAVISALGEKVTVITGGPGTGKTTLIRGVITIQSKKKLRIVTCAPTGRAAQRLTETTGLAAKTIHRLLEFDPATGHFIRNLDKPLAADVVIADEVSMIDTVLANQLLSAIPTTAQVILVGDADQLPSVGPGSVLGDVIRSGVLPVIQLTQVFRQAEASRITTNAHRINRGASPVLTGGRDDFFWVERDEPEAILDTIRGLVARHIPDRFGIPHDGIQVLTPMRRGTLGSGNLNRELQQLLNPSGQPLHHGSGVFRVGDRVMQLHNDYEKDVFNGDLGRIAGIDEEENELIVAFGDRQVRYDIRDLDDLDLAYACSVHKSQGSEYPAVVIPLHTQHYVMLQRNLLYTAVTRGRQAVVLVASKRALGIALRNDRLQERHTLLRKRLVAALSSRVGV